MRIVEIRERTAPLSSGMRNAVIDFSEMTVSVVAVITDEVRSGGRVVGFGFNSNGRYGQPGLLRERFIPRLLKAAPNSLLAADGNLDPFACWRTMMANEKPGGHGDRSVAVGTLDMAIWDATAKAAELPLHQLLFQRFGDGTAPAEKVHVYAAGGYYQSEKGEAGLVEEMRGYLDLGYRTVKIKIGGAALDEDRRRIESVLAILPPGGALAVDANGRFELEAAVAYGEMLAQYPIEWYEEPCDPLDYRTLAALAEVYEPPLATGENLLSAADARNLLRHGGMRPDRDLLQFDPALSYGVVEYLRTLDELSREGWSRRRLNPHGGHQLNLEVAAGLGLGQIESYPGVFRPFGGFADSTPVEDGFVRPSQVPGIGLEEKRSLIPLLSELGRPT